MEKLTKAQILFEIKGVQYYVTQTPRPKKGVNRYITPEMVAILMQFMRDADITSTFPLCMSMFEDKWYLKAIKGD
jgi:hypothetical protein